MHLPRDTHWKAIKRILRYLQRTQHFCLHITKSVHLTLAGFFDGDWASNLDDRKSTSGFFIIMEYNIVSLIAKK